MPAATHASPLTSDTLQAMVDSWIARNGCARRFLPGESVDFFAIQSWLQRRGHALSAVKGRFVLESKGRSRRNLLWREIIDLVDDLRVAEGLEPYRM